MLNSREHIERLAACPHCGSSSIRIRQRVRPYRPWRCRSCNKVFGTPDIREFVLPPGKSIQGSIYPSEISGLESRSRLLRRRLRALRLKRVFTIVAVIAIPAAISISVWLGVIPLPTQLQKSEEMMTALIPSASPIAIAPGLPVLAAVQIPTLTTTSTPIAGPSITPAAEAATSGMGESPTSADTPVATVTVMVVPTLAPVSDATPVPTSTPTPVPTSSPTATPVPARSLVLDADVTVEGYWSDGTANVSMNISLRNEGSLPTESSLPIKVSCSFADDAANGCVANTELSLPDGFGPAAASVVLRVPVGVVNFHIDYSDGESLAVEVDVPERILGVDRDIWARYSDRSVSNNSEGFNGCYGWYRPTVEKWRSDSTVRVWATGTDNYIKAFRETLDE